jgi:cytochrome c-type biogenesis protein CcmH
MTAQARFLAADRQLDDQTQLLAEQALAIDPQQRTALSLLGMAAFEKGAYATAVNYWERLQMQEAPGSEGYGMLAQAMRVARERGGLDSDRRLNAGASNAAEQADLPGISVALRLPEDLSADPQAVVFVFARRADAGSGMPVAVRRLQVSQLPLTLRLSDSDAMAGQRLSEAGAVLVSAQISANGQPGLANALYSGVAGPVSAGGTDVAVSIELRDAQQRG